MLTPPPAWSLFIERVQGFQWFTPEAALTEDLSAAEAWAREQLQEHCARLSPFTKAPLPAIYVRASRDAIEISTQAGFPIQAPTNALPGPSSGPSSGPSLDGSLAPWSAAISKAHDAMSTTVRQEHAPQYGLLRRLAIKLRPRAYPQSPTSDPWSTLTDMLSPIMKPIMWPKEGSLMSLRTQWGDRGSSPLIHHPSNAIKRHLLWLFTFAEQPSPWEPILSLWERGAWPVLCADGSVALYLPETQPERAPPTRAGGPPLVSTAQGDGWIQYSRALPLGVMPDAGMSDHGAQGRGQLTSLALGTGLGPPPCRLSFPPVGNPPFRPK